jgi:leucyl aminopeptidase
MELKAEFLSPSEVQADWLVVPIWQGESLADAAGQLDRELGGVVTRLRDSGDCTGKTNELTALLDVQKITAKRLLLVGLGPRDKAQIATLTTAAAVAARAVTGKQVERLALVLPAPFGGASWERLALAAGVGLYHGSQGPGLRKSTPSRFCPRSLILVAPRSAPAAEIESGTRRAEIEGKAVALARELVNTPPCDLYPESLASRAREVAAAAGIDCTVLDENQIAAERMGALLGVARGSDRPPRLVVLRYRHGGEGKTLALVGKGVTFDSGGLSLKPTDHMVDMKCDMAGAAAVLAAFQAVATLQLPVNLLGVMPLVENMLGGRAMKLGDVLHARNGKTIEVLNTDAEGRLILSDALAYAVDQKVDHIVDLATLTGACVVALGTEVVGVMSNNDAWSSQVQAAAKEAGEMVWPLPMFPHYSEMIKSSVADMKNTGGSRYAGAISAAKFLEEFVGTTPWTHLDIAGPAWADKDNTTRDAGGTGAMVRTLVALARAYGAGAEASADTKQ